MALDRSCQENPAACSEPPSPTAWIEMIDSRQVCSFSFHLHPVRCSYQVNKHSTIPYLHIVSYCAIVTLPLRRAVFTIFDFKKCCDLENRVRGPSRSLEMSPCDRAHMTFYWRSTVSMALSRVVSEIFNVEKCRDIEIGVRGHSRSLKVVPFGRSCMVSY